MSEPARHGKQGGSGSRSCGVPSCVGGLDCLANHCVDLFGRSLSFGFSVRRGVDVRSSTIHLAGLGLFSERHFCARDVITTYDGHVVHCTRFPKAFQVSTESAYSHFCSISGSEFLIAGLRYAADGRGMGSFANHKYVANARLSSRFGWFPYFGHFGCIGLDMHVVLIATKSIQPNEEIFIRYSKHSCTRLGIDYYE